MTTPGWMAKLTRPASLWRTALGWVCVCAGIAGIILPVIPGLPLLLAGLVILSARYRWAAVGVRWLRRKVSQVSSRRAERKQKVGA
jgi:uncharacterized membrane protein YbaN (DUF454 family)